MISDLTQVTKQIEAEAARLREIPLRPLDASAANLRTFESRLDFEPETELVPGAPCDVRAILQFDGHEFIRQCYRHLLRREPDADGLAFYYDFLLRGRKKFEVLLRLRFSREGRIARTRLVRWFWPAFYLVFVSIPVIGYFFDAIVQCFLLPRTLGRLALRQELLRNKLNRILEK